MTLQGKAFQSLMVDGKKIAGPISLDGVMIMMEFYGVLLKGLVDVVKERDVNY